MYYRLREGVSTWIFVENSVETAFTQHNKTPPVIKK